MKAAFQALRLLLFLIACSQHARAQRAPELLRLLILDKSGSMEGERLDQLKRTVREWIETYPPSTKAPFAIVPFDRQAGSTRVFTDKDSIERFLSGLRAGGGTSIASGLNAGADFLRDYLAASNLVILLVTDGEDTVNPEGVPVAEARLDAIFAKRNPDLLPTSVFVQRWDNVNDDLVRRWLGKPGVKVYDLGSKKPVLLTITPHVTLKSVDWTSGSAARLRVTLDVALDVRGALPTQEPLEVEVLASATHAVIAGMESAIVGRNGGSLSFELSPLGEPANVDLTLAFTTPTAECSSGPLIAQFAEPVLTLPVVVPRIPLGLTARISEEEARWTPAGTIASTVALEIVASCVPASEVALDVDFGSARVLGGSLSLRLAGGVRVRETYTLEVDAPRSGERCLITARVLPRSVPWPLELAPDSELSSTVTVATPVTESSTLEAQVKFTREPRWTNLALQRAAFEAELLVTSSSASDGVELVAEHAASALATPTHAVLSAGRAAIPLRIEAPMRPGELARFEILVSPSSRVPAGLTIEPIAVPIEVQGPPPASLRLLIGSTDADHVPSLALARTPWSGAVPVTPVLSGPLEDGAGAGLGLHLTSPEWAAGTELALGRATVVALKMSGVDLPYLEDRALTLKFEASPSVPLESLEIPPGELRVTLVARHKWALVAGSAALILLTVFVFGIRIHSQSSTPASRLGGEVT